jgi:hypothetical protein
MGYVYLSKVQIHITSDSKKLICTEILLFGVYQSPEKQYHAIINGNDMTPEIYKQARQVFISHGGKKLSDIEPTKSISSRATTTKETGDVVFVREYQEAKMGGLAMCTYKMYRADNAQSAKEFLSKVVVTEQLYYVVVGRLMCVMPFLDKAWPTADWATSASAGATQGMASLTTSLAASSAFAAPFEGSWVEVPTMCNTFQKGDDLLGSFWRLSCQAAAYQNALHRFGHIQPGATNRCVQRHDSMFDQPSYKAWRMVSTQIIPDEQHA